MGHSLLIITNLITPYRIDYFNALSKKLGENNFYVLFYYEKWKVLPWHIEADNIKFNHLFLEEEYGNRIGILKLIKILIPLSFSNVLLAGHSIYSIITLIIFKVKHAKVFLWTEEREKPKGSKKLQGIENNNKVNIITDRIKNHIRYLIRKYSLPFFDSIVSVSELSKNYFIEQYNISPDKINVVLQTNTIPCSKKQNKKINHKIKFLYVGKLEKYKYVDFLIECFNRLNKNYLKNISLSIYGEGSERNILNLTIEKNGLNKIIRLGKFIESRKELEKIYLSHDVFIIGSHETFGVVLIEALSAGLVLLSSSEVGAANDVIKQGENGYIFNHLDSNDCIDKLGKIINTPYLHTMKNNSLKIAENYYVDNLAEKMKNIIHQY